MRGTPLSGRSGHARAEAGVVTFGRVPDLVLTSVVVLCLPWLAAIVVPFIAPWAARVDPHDYWVRATAHQLGVLVLTIAAIKICSNRPLGDWGFNFRKIGLGLGYAALFALVVTPIMYWLMERQPAPTTPLAAAQIVPILLTHLLIIGFTQEALFRAFAMGMLRRHWSARVTAFLTSTLFMLAHVKFAPPYVWPEQLLLAFLFGLAYAYMYERTGSLFGPSLAHGFSNTVFVALMMLQYFPPS